VAKCCCTAPLMRSTRCDGKTARTAFAPPRPSRYVWCSAKARIEPSTSRFLLPEPFIPRSAHYSDSERMCGHPPRSSVSPRPDKAADNNRPLKNTGGRGTRRGLLSLVDRHRPARARKCRALDRHLPGVPFHASHLRTRSIRHTGAPSSTCAGCVAEAVMVQMMSQPGGALQRRGFARHGSWSLPRGGVMTRQTDADVPVNNDHSGRAWRQWAAVTMRAMEKQGVDRRRYLGRERISTCRWLRWRPNPPTVKPGWPAFRRLRACLRRCEKRGGDGAVSLAWSLPAALLHVARICEGAGPGPACTGRGATRPRSPMCSCASATSTDFILGWAPASQGSSQARPGSRRSGVKWRIRWAESVEDAALAVVGTRHTSIWSRLTGQ
jgi:hypothetical protein